MNIKLKSSLIEVIDKWMNKHCDDDEWPNAYVYRDLAGDMATGAEIVFDANVKGQKFAEEA